MPSRPLRPLPSRAMWNAYGYARDPPTASPRRGTVGGLGCDACRLRTVTRFDARCLPVGAVIARLRYGGLGYTRARNTRSPVVAAGDPVGPGQVAQSVRASA